MQTLVLGFFAVAWISLVAILGVEPEIYDQPGAVQPGTVRVVVSRAAA